MNWQKIKLGDVAEKITKGTTPTTIGFDFENKGVNFIKVESIGNFGLFIKDSFAYISEKCHNALSRSQIQENDILFSIAGAIGRIALVNEEILPANTNQALAIIRLKNEGTIKRKYLTFYLEHLVESGYFDILMSGVAQKNVSLQQLNDLIIQTPVLAAQKKIVTILEKWDATIENLKQQILEEEKLLKFIINNELSNTKNSQNKKFDDIFQTISVSGLKEEEYQKTGIYPVFDQNKNKYISGYTDAGIHLKVLEKPVILFGDHSRAVKYIDIDKCCFGNDGIKLIVPKGNLDEYFGYILIKNQRIPNTGYNRHFKYLKEKIYQVPSVGEQGRIAHITRTQDQKLSLLRQKLSNYESQRKYLLNRLLSGKEDI